MAATRTARKKAPARKRPVARPKNPTTSPAGATKPETAAVDLEVLAGVAEARDMAADVIDSAREQAAALQADAERAAARTVADTHEQVTVLMAEAQTRAAGITADAEQEATAQREAVLADLEAARGEADQLLAQARERAATLVSEARAQVIDLTELAATDRAATVTAVAELRRLAEADLTEISRLVDQRRTEAGQILARAQEQADDLVAAAQREVDKARERFAQLAATAADQYDGRRAEAEALYADAVRAADDRRREADTAVAAAHREAESARAGLRDELRQLGEDFDREAASKRAVLDKELAGLKAACDKQRERLREEAKTVTVQLREAAQKEAGRITTEAERKAKAVTERAKADEARARRLLEEAREAKKEASRWNGWQQNISRKAWKTAPWIALAAGVGLAASGEYELARMVGINQYVAPLLPVSIDVYCVTAFRAKKDIPYALLLMASANVTYHLSEQAHLVQDGQSAPWQLTTFVVLIFVAVIWRVHTLMHDDGTDDGNGTPARTGTHRRSDGSGTASSSRTEGASDSLYAAPRTVHADGAGTGWDGTDPVRPASHPPHDGGTEGAVSRAYSDRTGGVHTPSQGAVRTGTATVGRTGTASAAAQGRSSAISVRTQPGGKAVPGARTGTDAASSPATGMGSTAGAERSGTPVRTDEELLPLVQDLPRDADGFVTLYRARTDLSVNKDRAVRLLSKAGLLRPEDADKHLS
ncbi:hypothetical protein GCM10010329_80810 [Streptomyces spiroverticillatus]|uniref:Large alanine-rich protein n=1 Tax=Streptomyces finlayi TaxID=67296 RepID=A0A918X6W3_9ACTN|nr:hypothetical protein [Streptomyces finlayi]GHA46028.1 hypothetical protein GCM10010329_80810 [Streptomyces spiroverticillatus]GHD16066.1 hypothetical protein GCM10010334_76730 [Streptomyces finlayi]